MCVCLWVYMTCDCIVRFVSSAVWYDFGRAACPCIMRFLRIFLEILKTAPQCGLHGPNTGGFALGRVLWTPRPTRAPQRLLPSRLLRYQRLCAARVPRATTNGNTVAVIPSEERAPQPTASGAQHFVSMASASLGGRLAPGHREGSPERGLEAPEQL